MRMATMIWLLALALTVTGCAPAADAGDGDDGVASLQGEGASGAEPTPSASPAADREEAALAFSQCLREHGVDFPDPGSSGEAGIEPEQMEDPDFQAAMEDPDLQAAQEACEPLLETAFGDFQPDREEEARRQEQALAFSQCMRDQGIDFPDPVFEEGGARIGGGPGEEHDLDPEDPAFQEAHELCGEETGFDKNREEEP